MSALLIRDACTKIVTTPVCPNVPQIPVSRPSGAAQPAITMTMLYGDDRKPGGNTGSAETVTPSGVLFSSDAHDLLLVAERSPVNR